jgi:hypothetical protein
MDPTDHGTEYDGTVTGDKTDHYGQDRHAKWRLPALPRVNHG